MSLDNLTGVEAFRWFSLGQAVGRGAVKEATMYSYNGVVLPKLPEWDSPYVMIRTYSLSSGYPDFTSTTYYTVYFLNVRPYYDESQNTLGISEAGSLVSATCVGGADAWGDLSDEVSISTAWGGYIPFWANFDILNEDGTVYLVGSDPIPVYE